MAFHQCVSSVYHHITSFIRSVRAKIAFMWFLTSVPSLVLFKISLGRERRKAQIAFERLFNAVSHLVSYQIAITGKSGYTLVTFEYVFHSRLY